ncbi:MAG: response regulator [Anaerolineae bacterium]|nr:response regulator [Anaerolineae bacterium]
MSAEVEPATLLGDLRQQMTGSLAGLLIAASVAAIVSFLPLDTFPLIPCGLWVLLLILGLVVCRIVSRHPAGARHLLVWGVLAVLLIALWATPEPWVPFLGVMLAFGSAILLPDSEWIVAGVTGAAAAWLGWHGLRSYPLRDLTLVLLLGAALARLLVRSLYTPLQWAWSMQRRADQLLEVARSRQAELNSTLRSLELAYALQRRMQDELVAARQRAEDARRMKEQFAANISHELRTPLNLILGFSEVMCLSPEVYGNWAWPAALREDLQHVYQSSKHLLEMIDDILDLSRFEMVGFTLRREPTPVDVLLRNAADIAGDLFRGKPVTFELAIAPNLPTLELDRTRIRQVVLNLLNNAQRFTSSGTVRLEAQRVNNEVVITVSDTGPGIPADKLPFVFDEYYQVDQSLSRKQQGAGLGLAICKRFVEAHDGRIWVESREGVGSRFSFALPIPGQYPLAPHLYRTELRERAAVSRPCVLLVEPDRAVATAIERHLPGYEVVQIADSAQLPGAVASFHPRAVVWNAAPGPVDRKSRPDLPVPVIECSVPSQAWVADGLGVVGCLNKPVTSGQLLPVLARLGNVHDVLIVDDDPGFGQLVQRMLLAAKPALAVRVAHCGSAGLAAMREQRPDLVLLDLVMPEMDGFQLLAAMRDDPTLSGLPVLLLTARSLAEDVLSQRESQLVVRRAGGLRPGESLRCLQALLDVLEPGSNSACESPNSWHSLTPGPASSGRVGSG